MDSSKHGPSDPPSFNVPRSRRISSIAPGKLMRFSTRRISTQHMRRNSRMMAEGLQAGMSSLFLSGESFDQGAAKKKLKRECSREAAIMLLDRCVIHPNSRPKAIWDLLILAFVLYTSISAPLKVAYTVDFYEELEPFLDGLFAVDIIVQSMSGFFSLGGSRFPVLEWSRVVHKYAKTWLLLDLLAAIPFDAMLPELRFVSLIKTVRLVKFKRVLRKYNNMSFGPLLRVVTILSFWLLCAHWVACGFFAIGWSTCARYAAELDPATGQIDVQCSTRGSPCGGNWVTQYWPDMQAMCVSGQSPPSVAAATGLTIRSMHLRTLAWALATMSSMGYGQSPVAISDFDYIYAFTAQVLGACISAAIFSNFAQLMNKADAAASRYQEQLQKIHELDKLYKLPPDARKNLLDYHELIFSAYNGFDLKAVARTFPQHLQSRIFYQLHKDLVLQVPMFEGCDDKFLEQLIMELGVQVVLQEDYAFRKNDLGELMYFLQLGTIDIGNEDMSVVYVTKEAGSYFGEIAVFSNERRTASAFARTDAIMYTLSKSGFESVAIRFPESYHKVYGRAQDLLLKVQQANSLKDSESMCGRRVSERRISPVSTDSASSADSSSAVLSRGPLSVLSGGPAGAEQFDPGIGNRGLRSDSITIQAHANAIAAAAASAAAGTLAELEGKPNGCPPNKKAPPSAPPSPAPPSPAPPSALLAHERPSPPPTPPAMRKGSGNSPRALRKGSGNGGRPPREPHWRSRSLQTKRLPVFHTTELASLPPASLAPLYSGQVLGMIHEEVVPTVLDTQAQLASLRDELMPILLATQKQIASVSRAAGVELDAAPVLVAAEAEPKSPWAKGLFSA